MVHFNILYAELFKATEELRRKEKDLGDKPQEYNLQGDYRPQEDYKGEDRPKEYS